MCQPPANVRRNGLHATKADQNYEIGAEVSGRRELNTVVKEECCDMRLCTILLQFRNSSRVCAVSLRLGPTDVPRLNQFILSLPRHHRLRMDRFRHDCWWKDFSHFFGLGDFPLEDLQRKSQAWNLVFFTKTVHFFSEPHYSQFFSFWGFSILIFALHCYILEFSKF